jgi:transcription elongation factor S-II
MAITALELTKLLNAAVDAAKQAEGGVNAAEEGRTVDALRVLGQQRVTTELLAETEAGKRVKRLTKHSCPAVAKAAAAAVDAWKDCIRREQGMQPATPSTKSALSGGGAGGAASSQLRAASPSVGPGGGSQQPQQAGSQPLGGGSEGFNGAGAGGSGGATSGGGSQQGGSEQALAHAYSNKLVLEPARTGDGTRDKIRKLLAEALALALGPGVFGDPCSRAVEAETALFVQNGGVNAKYKTKFRSLSFNLKDPKNPDLRSKVCGCGCCVLHVACWVLCNAHVVHSGLVTVWEPRSRDI